VVQRWQALARASAWREVVQDLLTDHYDPGYQRSMQRNFAGFDDALPLHLADGEAATLAAAARTLAG